MKDRKIKGVTLIALAVTIIVMLILAGVTISALTGNSGIATKANEARYRNMAGQIKEIISIKISEMKAEALENNTSFTFEEQREKVMEELKKNGFDPQKKKHIKMNDSQTLIIINKDNVISLATGDFAICGEDGVWDWVSIDVDKKEVGICGYNGEDEEITIPEYILYKNDVYTVTALKNCSGGHDAFKLKSPNTTEDHKFKANKKVKSIKMLENITSIDGGEFLNNDVIENIEMSDNMQSFHSGAAFFECTKLKSCKLSEALKIIPNNLFQNCTLLEEVNIPEGVTEIGAYAFSDVKSMKKVVIPSSVTKIDKGAFSNMTKLQEIVMSEGVEELEEKAFSNATAINVDLHLPSTLKLEKIGKNAFWGFGKKVYLSNGTQVSTKWVN